MEESFYFKNVLNARDKAMLNRLLICLIAVFLVCTILPAPLTAGTAWALWLLAQLVPTAWSAKGQMPIIKSNL
jgi:hypothetical protein